MKPDTTRIGVLSLLLFMLAGCGGGGVGPDRTHRPAVVSGRDVERNADD